MRILKIITHPYIVIISFFAILISGEGFGGFYLLYLLLALPYGGIHSLLALIGIVLLLVNYNKYNVLLNRIRRMIEKKEKTFFNYRHQLMAFFVMLTVLSSLAMLSSSHQTKNAAVSSASPQVITKQITAGTDNTLFDPVLFMSSGQEKAAGKKEQKPKKNQHVKSLHSDDQLAKIAIKNTNSEIEQQVNSNLRAAKVNPVLSSHNYEPSIEDLQKDLEISNVRLNEVTFNIDAFKEWELALVEESLKDLAADLFDKKKAAWFDQKKIIEQMKAAFEQIKMAKIQFELAKRNLGFENEKRDNVKENQLRIIQRFAPGNIDKSQWITKELQVQTEQPKEQAARVSELHSFYNNNNNLNRPEVIYHFPFTEKPHSFSFEFSTEPKLKAVVTPPFHNWKRGKKTNTINEKEIRKNFKTENTSPFILNPPILKDGDDNNFVIIRI